jgi:tetratricopeptide (TPR) repeat protein
MLYSSRYLQIASAVALLAMLGCSRNAHSYVTAADEHYKQKRYEDASISYKKAISKDSKIGEAYYGLGLSQLELAKVPEAFQALRQAAALLPERQDVKTSLADLTLAAYQGDTQNRGLYDLLAQLADELLAKGRSFDALRMKGNVLLLDRKPQEAIPYFREAMQVKPGQEHVAVGYIQSLMDAGKADEAESVARQFLRDNRSAERVYDVLYRYYLATARKSAATELLIERVRNNPKSTTAVILLAREYARNADLVAMYRTVDEMTAQPKRYENAFMVAGDFYSQRREWEKAFQNYEAGLKVDSGKANDYRKRIALMRLTQGRADDAAAMVDAVLAKTADDDEALLLKADILMLRGAPAQYKEAVSIYEGLRKRKPDDAAVAVRLGRAYVATKNLTAARGVFQSVVSKAPGFTEAKQALASISLMEGKAAEGLQRATEILDAFPKNGEARYLKVVALMNLGRHEEARRDLDLLMQAFPQSRDLRLLSGVQAVLSKRYGDAEAVFSRLRDVSDARVLGGLAEAYVGQQQIGKALTLLETEVKRSPGSAALRKLLAQTAVKAGQYDRAIAEFRQLAAAQPKSADLAVSLGNAYREKGDFDAASAALQNAAQLAPKSANAHLLLGFTYDKAGRFNEAVREYRQALAIQPGNPIVMNNLAFALAEIGGKKELDEALHFTKRAVQLHPDEKDFQDTLGWVYLKAGMSDRATEVFSTLCKQSPNNPNYQYHLGLALLNARDTAGARKAFELALSSRPQRSEEQQIRNAMQRLAR